MIKSYNSYVKHFFKLLMFVVIPVVLFTGMFIVHKIDFLGNFFKGDTNGIFAALSVTVFSMLIAFIWAIFDFYSFTATLNMKSQGIEYLKTSKRAKKYFMDVVVCDIIVKLVAYILLVFVALLEIRALTGFAVMDILKMSYSYIILGISICYCMSYINRHFNNAQTFMITNYLVFTAQSTILGMIQAIVSDAKANDGFAKYIDRGLAVFYGLVGITCVILTITKTRKCIDKSWYCD